jgi:hypothetical protein
VPNIERGAGAYVAQHFHTGTESIGIRMTRRFLSAMVFAIFLIASLSPAGGIRTVAKTEIGSIFAYPAPGMTWRDLGAYVGVAGSEYFHQMSPTALKIEQGRFQHFEPDDDNCCSYFPYSRLKQYETEEVAHGRPPLFVTATYEGKRRPVYFAWSMDLQGGDVPRTPSHSWMQAVDISSDRFIQFWINDYVRGRLWHHRPPASNYWVGLDNCVFIWQLYGVLDDRGHFVSGVRWDPPFAQNAAQYLASVKQFFRKIRQLAPEIKVMCNLGSLNDPNEFQSLFADVPGIMAENISELNPIEYARRKQYEEFTWVSWFGARGGAGVLRAIVAPSGDAEHLRTACAIYLLIKGQNFFFDPELQLSNYLIPPSRFEPMRSVLGDPTGSMKINADAVKGSPYNLYSRTYQHGIVYVNWTGKTQNISLPADHTHFDHTGRPVTRIALSDLAGTYVTTVHPDGASNGL